MSATKQVRNIIEIMESHFTRAECCLSKAFRVTAHDEDTFCLSHVAFCGVFAVIDDNAG